MEDENIIVLLDEDGNEIEFEYLDIIERDNKEYVVLMPVENSEDEEGEVVILERVENGEIEVFLPVEDENVLDDIFDEFKQRMKDEFEFADEE